MKYGLSKTIIDKICGVFSSFNQVEKAVLYGSRAKGNYKNGSDIDLSLFGKELTYSIYANIVDALDDLLLPYKIDLSVFETIENISLKEHIQRVGIVFYTRENNPTQTKAQNH
jgi:predicted nucleotidyltransferase